jgi:hypothetical protein
MVAFQLAIQDRPLGGGRRDRICPDWHICAPYGQFYTPYGELTLHICTNSLGQVGSGLGGDALIRLESVDRVKRIPISSWEILTLREQSCGHDFDYYSRLGTLLIICLMIINLA